jgi:WD40 repeat protein
VDKLGKVSKWTGVDLQQKASWLEMGTNVFSSCFSLDGRFLASCWTNGVLQVWDASQQVLLHQLTNTMGKMWACNFLADGKKLITYSLTDNSLHEWDLATRLEIQSWEAPAVNTSGALTPDDRSCMAIGYGGDVVFRTLADSRNTKMDLDILEAVSAGFAPDGKVFAAASDLGYARVWDAATWRPMATLGGFLNGAHSVSFSPDCKRLAIASDGKEAVKLWDTDSWQDVFTLEAQGTGFQGAAFSPDGNSIAWGNLTTLYVWRAPSWADIAAAEAKETTVARQP